MSEVYEANTNAMHRQAEWKAEARETAARIANDVQGLMAAAETVFLQWAEDGLLDRTRRGWVWNAVTGRHEWKAIDPRTSLEASAHHAACVREVMMDALSLSAREAIEEAGE